MDLKFNKQNGCNCPKKLVYLIDLDPANFCAHHNRPSYNGFQPNFIAVLLFFIYYTNIQ
ncbi:MAG: hypothetical protein JWP44_1009 [Mucilaginibacter sp.]|nr:hypothetical protein [Mucilaginibacter sp.]